MTVSIEFNGRSWRDQLDVLRQGIIQAAEHALQDGVEAAEKSAKATTLFQDRSGAGGTRASIRGKAFVSSGFVQAGGAARFLENGTRPHVIRAKNGKVLRFMVNGETLFRRMVQHHGTTPRPFMHEARDVGEHVAVVSAEARVTEVVHRGR